MAYVGVRSKMCHFGVTTPCDLEHGILRQNQNNFVSLYLAYYIKIKIV